MNEELKNAIGGPKTSLLVIILLIGIPGLVILGELGNHLDAAFMIYLYSLLPFIVPYFLSMYYPKIAGWLLILEGILPILYFSLTLLSPSPRYENSIIILLVIALPLSILASIGIWMIVAIRKIQPTLDFLT